MAKEIYFDDIEIGSEMPVLNKGPLNKLQFVMYAGASGDFNPLHVLDEFAKSVGMEEVISHGMLVMGFVGQAVTAWMPKKYLKKLGVRFVGMTKPNSTITIAGKVVDKRNENGESIISCEVSAKDEQGDIKITGHFEASLPTR